MNNYNTQYFLFEDTGISNDQTDNGSKEIIFKANAFFNNNPVHQIQNNQFGIIKTNINRLKIPKQTIYYRIRREDEEYANNWLKYDLNDNVDIKKHEEDNVIPYKLETDWVRTPGITDEESPLIYTNYEYSHNNYRSFRRPTNQEVNDAIKS